MLTLLTRDALRPLSVAFSAMLAAATLPAQSARADQLIRRDSLPNGLTVIVVENHSVPLATAHVVFRGGAMTQATDMEGVPHLFEHMLFRSYGVNNDVSFGNDAAMAKSSYNGATSDEEVSYTLWFPSDELGGNVRLLADLVRDPTFRDKEISTERFVVRNEMQRKQSQPSYLLYDASRRALWGSWYGRKNTIGTEFSLFAANAERLKAIYKTWYVPNNAALVVTGDVSAEKVFNEARKQFGSWKRAVDPQVANAIPVPPPLDSTFAFVYTHEVQTVTVEISWRAPSLSREAGDAYDAETLADLLNADESLFQRQLVDAGLFQTATMSADINQHGSELRFTGTTTLDQLSNALSMFGGIVGQLSNTAYYDEAVLKADAKRGHVARVLAFEETASLASSLGTAWSSGRLSNVVQRDSSRSSTPESLAAFAGKWVVNRPYVIGVLTPIGSERAVSTTVAQYVAFMKQ
jgi:zinc protease